MCMCVRWVKVWTIQHIPHIIDNLFEKICRETNWKILQLEMRFTWWRKFTEQEESKLLKFATPVWFTICILLYLYYVLFIWFIILFILITGACIHTSYPHYCRAPSLCWSLLLLSLSVTTPLAHGLSYVIILVHFSHHTLFYSFYSLKHKETVVTHMGRSCLHARAQSCATVRNTHSSVTSWVINVYTHIFLSLLLYLLYCTLLFTSRT